MEAKFMIDGKEVALTDGDLKKIGVTEKKIKEFADRAEKAKNAKVFIPTPGEYYFYIAPEGYAVASLDHSDECEAERLSVGNYCKDIEMMMARATLEALHRLIWRESIIAGGNKVPWDGEAKHWFVYLNYFDCDENGSPKWDVTHDIYVRDVFIPYFPDAESARRVIDTVIEPFIAENPYFIDILRGKC